MNACRKIRLIKSQILKVDNGLCMQAAAETSILFAAVREDFSWSENTVMVCVKLQRTHAEWIFQKNAMTFRRQYGSG